MNVSSAAAAASSANLASVQGQASLMVFKKAVDLQEANALQLLQTIPQPAPLNPAATVGGRIDTYA